MADETSINFGQIIAVAVIGYLVFRWFAGPSSPAGQSSSGNASNQVNPAHVEQVAQMFPQLPRRSIMWDLQRNGGSVEATTERILSGRSLESPPPSFQPPIPQTAVPIATRTTAAAAAAAASGAKSVNPDLITRYNLTSKLNATSEGEQDEAITTGSSSGSKSAGWSANKNERAEALKRRREEMVLAARRKMEQRDRQKSVGS